MARSIAELSLDTQTLERLLGDTAIGGMVTYQMMSDALGRDVRGRARHVLQSAQRRLLRDQQMVFESVVNIGVKRMDDIGIVGSGVRTVRRIHNAARRGAVRLAAVHDFAALPNPQKVKHNLLAAQLGMLAYVTTDKAARRLEQATAHEAAPLPTAKLLDAIKTSL